MALLQKLRALQPRTKACAIALLLVTLVGYGLLEWEGEDLPFTMMVSGIYLLGAMGLAFRWRWFRVVALVPVALMAAMCLWGIVINAALAVVNFPSSLPAIFGLLLSALLGIALLMSARWLNGAEAKAYFSNTAT